MEHISIRKHSFGKHKAGEVLDVLLQNNPASTSVGKFLNKYREECKYICEIPNKKIACTLINKVRKLWLEELNSRWWSDEIKLFTTNVLTTTYRESIRKLNGISSKHNNP